MEIIQNFLNKNFFEDLKELVLESEFSWFQRKTFYNNHKINCDTYFKYILPILDKLDSKAVIEVRANLCPSVFFKKEKCTFHIDNSFNCKTAILYLNTCDGGTEFKLKDKIKFIKSEENKIVIFDSNIKHRAITSKDSDFRYILNFNYFN